MRAIHKAILTSVCLLTPAAAAGQPIIYVDDDAAPGGNGTTWQTAFRHLQDALSAASDLGGAELRVAQGVYRPDRSSATPNGSGDRLATFRLLDDVSLRGGYAGPDAPDVRHPATYASLLSGDLNGDDDAAIPGSLTDNAYHVIESWNNADTALVEGFTIAAGRADRPFDDGWWPDRRDDSGGGALLVGSDAVFRECLFTGNHAEANASVWVALSGPFAYAEAGGGALYIATGSPTIEDCVFESNTANRLGGAVSFTQATPRFARCLFRANIIGVTPGSDASFGGAMSDASMIFNNPGEARIESCVFIGNSAPSGWGGALFTIFTQSIYTNCVFLANHAHGAGAIMADNIAVTGFYNCAIVGNTSNTMAAGMHEISEAAIDNYVFANCIAWGNRSAQVFELRNENMISDNGNIEIHHTIVENSASKPVFARVIDRMLDVDPAFADPIGPDGLAYSGDEDLRPNPASPAIDAGSNAFVPSWSLDDLDGNPRLVDVAAVPDTGAGPAPIVDIGPYEAFEGCSPVDLAPPFGVHNLFDILAYLDLYNAGDPAADFAAPFGILNFFDVAAFIDLYLNGCP